jgi:hypothetical protein
VNSGTGFRNLYLDRLDFFYGGLVAL